jgi:lantibiotic modifying enzyme
MVGEAEFAERGRALASQAKLAPGLRDDGEADLLSGKAGAIVALLALGELLDEAAFTDRARTLGDALLQTAEVDDAMMSWRSPDQRRGRNLTGLVMLAFAMMAAIRHRANPPPPKKKKRRSPAKART